VSNVAIAKFLKTERSERRMWYRFLMATLQLLLVLLFLFTVVLSSIFMIERFVRRDVKIGFFAVVVAVLVGLIVLYSLWSALMFTVLLLIQKLLPQSSTKRKLQDFIKRMNEKIIVKGAASFMFGIDTSDMEGGKIIETVHTVRNGEIIARMDKIETLLERTLEQILTAAAAAAATNSTENVIDASRII
jgi:hypothetical protein